MSEPSKAVFLSYASQDAEAARRICEALRASGIEVWFDQSELRGGDVWDQKIRQQIQDCSLFMPVISAHTDERTEGYFRLEWKLAVDRSYLMADDAAFLFPVVIDDTVDALARVPERFRSVQWTRCPAGETPAAFTQRVNALLTGSERPSVRRAGVSASPTTVPARPGRVKLLTAIAVLALGAVALLAWREMTRAPGGVANKVATATASVIPEHSIAVLPFADLSASRDQEYFSDGLAEDVLNLLSKVPGLQVAARTSAFSFKGHAVDVPTIGRQLRVAHVLEGTVHKVGNHLRVTAQLERANDGYQIWSETYDRELGDVFRIQDDIANEVVKALKVSLLWGAAPRALGTQNSEAYLVFLQGRAKMATQLTDTRAAADDFARVLKLDPNYGPAYVELAAAKMQLAEFEVMENRQAALDSASAEAKLLIERALALDPNDAQAYVERGNLRAFHDREGAEKDYRRGIELNPNSARGYAALAGLLFDDPRRRDESLAMLEQARRLDPLDPEYDVLKAQHLEWAQGNLRAAEAILVDVVARYPSFAPGLTRLADTRRTFGHIAESIMYDEQALKLDPLSEWIRRELIVCYGDLEELAAARQVADEAPHRLPIHRMPLLVAEGNWHQAAELTYAAYADGTMDPASEPQAVFAVRMEARRTHEYDRALAGFESLCGVTWSDRGIPTVAWQLGFGYGCVAAGDMLMASGDRARAERLLRASLTAMDYAAHDLRRGEVWYLVDKATALALLGDRKAALAALRRAVSEGYIGSWAQIPLDPAFDGLRGDPEFQSYMGAIKTKVAHEREILAKMRSDGRVPDRSGKSTARPTTAKAPAGAR